MESYRIYTVSGKPFDSLKVTNTLAQSIFDQLVDGVLAIKFTTLDATGKARHFMVPASNIAGLESVA